MGSGDQGCWQTAGCVDSFGDVEVRGGGSCMSCWHRATHASHKKTHNCLRESVESLRWHLEVQDPQLGNHRTGPFEQRTVILGEGSGQ